MDKLQVIREMTAEDADLLPKPVREAVAASVPAPPEVALVAELRTELGDGDPLAVVREWKKQREEGQKTAVITRITELVSNGENGIKIEALRPLVTELVQAKNPATPEAAETIYNDVVKSAMVAELLKNHVAAVGGPPLRTGLQSQGGGVDYFPLPKKEGA